MKTFKTLAVAIIAAAALAFCATSARAIIIPVTTNYDIINFSATITTNGVVETVNSLKLVTKSQKLVTKDLLNMLTNSDFAGMPFPTGAKLVIGWDEEWNGDVLVVGTTGSNVLYDATTGNPTNNLTINFFSQTGAASATLAENKSAMYDLNLTWYNNASFKLTDRAKGTTIAGTGPCTQHFNLNGFTFVPSTNAPPSWSDSQKFSMYRANETNGITRPGTLSGSITASGKGKGIPPVLTEQVGPLIF